MEDLVTKYNMTLEGVLPLFQKRSKSSYIVAAILLITVKQIYSFFRVPTNLRHFPCVSFFAMAKSLLTCEPPYNRFKRITFPAIQEGNGFYVSKIPTGWTVYVANPVAAKQLLLKSDNFPKSHRRFDTIGEKSTGVQFVGRDNVVLSNGEIWKKQRKIMNPVFHRSMPIKTVASLVPLLFSAIEEANDFDFKALQGDPDHWTSTYRLVIQSISDPISNVFSALEPLLVYVYPKRRRSVDAVAKINAKFDQVISKKREELQNGIFSNKPDNEKDLVTLMLEAGMQEDVSITNEELRHNMAVLFLAGHDSTSNTLSFCLYHLAKNKRAQQKLREEIINILGDDDIDIVPSLEELKQMKYMNMVIKENLRINTPLDLLLPRKTAEDTFLADTFIPKDTIIVIDVGALQRDPRSWKDPDEFVPERFEDDGEQNSHEGLTWVPFSNGTRQCIGMNFSLMEQRLTLTMLLRKYEVDLPKDSIHYDHIIYEQPSYVCPESLELIFTKRY
ncbi:hypothetical protein RO3G_10685 [Rhizopus delemar RA 99-880]|uniref:Cytochrome P450 n=1 Tax=Rhizopus delemar (strain RA 99-880 / ATCC MYA-4621 / FGSC 9543 / NRRL 43880) TaxID=246409 RepID=I1CBZ5_RHIO9|nr:hypothetical protein RO3G_10685 [Rhizopus delemar RA 99-880]|eukprot:EIE85975.1 hypothetical protein RO3G_10685 [Rhizopus delemar RA 99-880]